MIGTTVSHYRILEPLGGGGKGVVYKAQDLRLQRYVALKFLSAQAGEGDEEVQRFLREARAASAIEHPNLCTVYEIDESDEGQLFLAMAFCEGETLKAKIERGPLDLELAVDLAVQVATGLGKAHERGIVHRDVKPANLIVSPDGQLKILDFGIAHLSGQTRLTRAGSMVGTAAYMSPEQLRSAPADPRMDVWALGVMLYEMVTGRPPFRGDEKALLFSILNRHPAPMSTLRPEVPSALDRIVSRALAKNPRDRYASMEEMRAELCSLRWSPTSPGIREPQADEALATPTAWTTGSTTADIRPEPPLVDRSVSHYKVVQRLGGGGMGVVYKAEDTLLQRTAALKFLPRRLTLDPEGKDRFLQEARTASALDHPNLCTIYEVGETIDGQLYLAMPYYDGETLRKRLERGPLPVVEAVDIATQMAQGLARVHRRGIVHRDIKPANLMVTADGIVKILDFGIAKLGHGAGTSPEAASIGTPAYMSPEQAGGGQVDPRSDLWSLGVVLYEMLAGRRPFRGDQEQAVIYAVLHDEPEPLSRLRPDVPAELDRIVRRLLSKDPAARYTSADEVFGDLRRLFGEASGAYFAPPPIAPSPAVKRRRAWMAAGAAAVLVAALIFAFRMGPEPNPFLDAPVVKLTNQAGSEDFPRISPDGSSIVYVKLADGDQDIFLQPIEGGEPVNLTASSPAADSEPTFSPDGSRIAFRSERGGGGIYLMDLESRQVRRLTSQGNAPAWSPDGREILYATELVDDPGSRSSISELWRVDVESGAPQRIFAGDAVQPSWSPNGLRIAFWGVQNSRRVVSTIPVDGGPTVPVVDDGYLNWNPVWSPDGEYLFYASDAGGSMNLWRVRIDEESGKVLGKPERIPTRSESSAWLSFSQDGRRMVYATNYSASNVEKAAFDPSLTAGPLQPVTQGSRAIRSADVSPDGSQVVFDTLSPQEDLFLISSDGGEVRQLTDDPAKDRSPRWSPDGSRIVFYSHRQGSWEAWSIRPDGTGLEQLTATGMVNPFWSPDGRRLAGGFGLTGKVPVLIDLTLPLAARKPVPLPLAEKVIDGFAVSSWSPDGRWLAGQNAAGLLLLYSFAERRLVHLREPGSSPVWLRDGKTLLFPSNGRIRALDRQTGEVRDVLVPPPYSSFGRVSLSSDEQSLYTVSSLRQGDVWLLKLS